MLSHLPGGSGGGVPWPLATLRQGHLPKWNGLSPSLIKIQTSLIGRQRLFSLWGSEGTEHTLNVNFLCSLHVGAGSGKGEEEGCPIHPPTQSSRLLTGSLNSKMKRAQDLEQVTWVELQDLFLTSEARHKSLSLSGPQFLYLPNDNKMVISVTGDIY